MHDQAQEAFHRRVSRRILIAGAGIAAAGAAGGAVRPAIASESAAEENGVDALLAKREIEELRRLYARATDLIGMVTDESIAEGRAIYHRIFTPDAKIGAEGVDPAVGPDAWVDVVAGALKDYAVTQHLIGTQLVDIESLPDGDGIGGAASMMSYVQAWHSTADEVWLFLGTYWDKLAYSEDAGWQIKEMVLKQTAMDRRPLSS